MTASSEVVGLSPHDTPVHGAGRAGVARLMGMDALVTLHLILATVLTLALVGALALVARGTWNDRAATLLTVFATVATAQWVLGIFVWFSSIQEDFNLFTGLIHPIAMTGVLGLAHITNARSKSVADPVARAKGVRTLLAISAVLVLALAPWQSAF